MYNHSTYHSQVSNEEGDDACYMVEAFQEGLLHLQLQDW